MSLTLVSTAGGSTSNAYCTLASANVFLQENIHTYTAWSSLTTANREACLIWATTLLDKQMAWTGTKATEAQALRWPRQDVSDPDGYSIDDDYVPTFLQRATAEYARWLSLKDRTAENPTLGFSRLEAGGLAAYIAPRDRAQVMPAFVYDLVKAYGNKATGQARVLERR